jgi:hypothetical protein
MCCISLSIYQPLLTQYASHTQVRSLLLIPEQIDQRPNMRSDLYRELVASLQSLFGRLAHTYSGGGTGNDDRSCWQSRALGEEADEFGDPEDEVTINAVSYWIFVLQVAMRRTLVDNLAGFCHSSSHGCEVQTDQRSTRLRLESGLYLMSVRANDKSSMN